jgi:hypothetical protein
LNPKPLKREEANMYVPATTEMGLADNQFERRHQLEYFGFAPPPTPQQPIHISERVGNKTIDFHVYANIPDLAARIQTTLRNLRSLPPGHIDVLDPFFIVNRLPGWRATGGGYYRPGVESRRWLGRGRITGVPDADLDSYVLAQPNRGIIGITRAAFLHRNFQFTVFHELAHSVDYHIGIIPPGSRINDFRGVIYPSCSNPRPIIGEYAAEAYARFILQPWRVCRECDPSIIPANETMQSCSARIINLLMTSPAFRGRGIPPTWRPPRVTT